MHESAQDDQAAATWRAVVSFLQKIEQVYARLP